MTSSRKYLKANTRVLGRLASLRSTPTCRSTRIQGTLTTSCVCRPNWTRRRLSWYVDFRLVSRNRDSERIISTRPWSPYFNAGRSWMILSIGLKLSPCRARCSTRRLRRFVTWTRLDLHHHSHVLYAPLALLADHLLPSDSKHSPLDLGNTAYDRLQQNSCCVLM